MSPRPDEPLVIFPIIDAARSRIEDDQSFRPPPPWLDECRRGRPDTIEAEDVLISVGTAEQLGALVGFATRPRDRD